MSNKLRIVMTGGETLIAELAPGQDLLNLADLFGDNPDKVLSVTLINGDAATPSNVDYLRNLLGDKAVSVRADGAACNSGAIPAGTRTVMVTRDGKGARRTFWRMIRLHRVA